MSESFGDLNTKYQKCVNSEYTRFLRGDDIDFSKSRCNALFDELKKHEKFKGYQEKYDEEFKNKKDK